MKRIKKIMISSLCAGMVIGSPAIIAAQHEGSMGSEKSGSEQSGSPGMGSQSGQMESQPGMMGGQQQSQQQFQRTPDMASSYQSEKLVGMKIKNNKDEDLGEIKQLILDQSGQVTHVVLSTGGVLGLGEDTYAVPWDRIQLQQQQDFARVDVDKGNISSEFAAFEAEERKEKQQEKQQEQQQEQQEQQTQ